MPKAPTHKQLMHCLTQNATFTGLDTATLEQLLAAATLKKFLADEILLRQGDDANTFIMMVKGRAKLTQLTVDGTQILVRYISPGQECGILSLLPGMSNLFTTQAMDNGLLLSWSGSTLASFMPVHPQIAQNALRMLAERNHDLQKRYQELLTECVAQRLAHALLRLVAQAGLPLNDGILIDLPISREDLAQLAGTTLYTVSRTLRFWEQAGLVESGRQRIVIKRIDELEALAAAPTTLPA